MTITVLLSAILAFYFTSYRSFNRCVNRFAGINTIPELPPQHESKYVGLFAADGSLVKKPPRNNSLASQISANEVFIDSKMII